MLNMRMQVRMHMQLAVRAHETRTSERSSREEDEAASSGRVCRPRSAKADERRHARRHRFDIRTSRAPEEGDNKLSDAWGKCSLRSEKNHSSWPIFPSGLYLFLCLVKRHASLVLFLLTL